MLNTTNNSRREFYKNVFYLYYSEKKTEILYIVDKAIESKKHMRFYQCYCSVTSINMNISTETVSFVYIISSRRHIKFF